MWVQVVFIAPSNEIADRLADQTSVIAAGMMELLRVCLVGAVFFLAESCTAWICMTTA
jgi:hypothetical protein